jgi:hypothetical protein
VGNLVLHNPSEPQETVAALVRAVLLDEALLASTSSSSTANAAAITALQASNAYALYTSAGAIAPAGRAILKTGTAGHMTLVAPAADNILLIIIAADAEAYLVTCGTAGKLNGGTVGTFGGAIGDSLILLSSGGVWLAVLANGVVIA